MSATLAQAALLAARILRIETAGKSAAPTDVTTAPDLTMSPLTPTALPTSGFVLCLKQPAGGGAAVPSGAGSTFSLTIWVRNPVTKIWAAGEAVAIPYAQWWVTDDIGAAELYFQIGTVLTDGELDLHFGEI